MFNQIKRQERKPVTKAKVKTLFRTEEAAESRVNEKNIFCARKGAQALMHPLFRKLYTFGGVGRRAISDIEAFDEGTLEFAKLTKHSGRPLGVQFTDATNVSHHGSNQPRPAGAMKHGPTPRSRGDLALNFSGPSDAHSQAEDKSEAEQKLEDGRFYHLMLPYKNYLCVYGGQSNTGGHAHRGYRPVQSEIFLYDLLKNRWSEV